MTDVVNNVVTNFLVNNKGAVALSSLSASASRVSSLFDRASGIVGTFGSVAAIAGGAMSLTHVIKGTQSYLESIKKVQDYTKMTAENAGGLVDAMESVGIGTSEATRALMMMSRAGARAAMTGRGMRQNTAGMGREYKRLGIDMQNPEKAMFRMSELVKSHRIDQAKVGLLMRVQGDTARKLTNMLMQGPEALKAQMKEYAKLGIATQANVDRQERIRLLGLKIGSSWENIQRIIGVQLLPVVEDLMSRLSKTLEAWVPYAQKFGENLSMWLHEHLDTVKQVTKVLLLNFTLMKLTGTGMIGWGQKALGGFGRMALGGGVVTAAAGAASGGAAPAIGLMTRLMGIGKMHVGTAAKTAAGSIATATKAAGVGFATRVRGEFTAIKEVLGARFGRQKVMDPDVLPVKFKSFFTRDIGPVFARARPFFAQALRFVGTAAVLAIVIASIVKAVQLIRANVDGIGTYVQETFGTIIARFQVIADMFDVTFGEGSALGEFFHKFVFGVVMVFADVLDAQVHLLQTIMETIRFIVKFPMAAIKEGLPQVFARAWDYTEQQTREKQRVRGIEEAVKLGEYRKQKALEATKERETAPYNDFRNSRFDITQKFAEGFDPDRIALSFTSDLAALGERKLQSGFSPLYAVR